jgi:3-methyladenine DNA glycosylase/8-oxoguanine DNA glycosylase
MPLSPFEKKLIKTDPAFATLVKAHAPCALINTRRGGSRSHFAELAQAITYQQLAGRAAETIHGRFVTAIGGRVTPEAVLATEFQALRDAGLSAAKATSIVDLADKSLSGQVKLKSIARCDDEAIIEQLTIVRGIGRWTAEMFLMFRLGRLDVWPTGDYGVRKGWTLLHGAGATANPKAGELITPKQLESAGDKFGGYRSIVAWYCWRAADTALSKSVDGDLANS